jgi:uncharacterized alpha-E superfamily protein
MLSRVASSLYWLARNFERAETVARVLDFACLRSADFGGASPHDATTLRLLTIVGPKPPEGTFARREEALAYGIFSTENPSSIVSTIAIARANALGVRAQLSTEIWESTNRLWLYLSASSPGSVLREGPSHFLQRVRDACQAFAGISDATLAHDDVWDFIQAGRFSERADLTARMLAAAHGFDAPWPCWQQLLNLCCASEPFARLVPRLPSPVDVLEFLTFSPQFPRSIRFCIGEIDAALHRISGTAAGSYGNDAEKESGRLRARFDYTRVSEVLDAGTQVFAERTVASLAALSEALERAYFPRVPVG